MKRRITVRTFDQEKLEAAAQSLAAAVLADFKPGLVIGVRSGGYAVAALMMPFLPAGTPLLPVTCRRRGSHAKRGLPQLSAAFAKLPYFLTDRLRMLEHAWLMRKRQRRYIYFSPDASEVSLLSAACRRALPGANILIVDDAVDSGATLAAVISLIPQPPQQAFIVKTAAIAVTTSSPLVQPDYHLYSHALCRFPWSFDFRR